MPTLRSYKEACCLGDEQKVVSSALKCSRTNDSNLTHTFSDDEKKEYFPAQFHAIRPLVQKAEEKSQHKGQTQS